MDAPPRPDDAPAPEPLVPWSRLDKFMGQLTHDIRNGLNVIELQLALVDDGGAGPEILTALKTLRGTVAGISRSLEAVRAPFAPLRLSCVTYSVHELVEDFRERADGCLKGQPLTAIWQIGEIPNHGVTTEADPALLLSALASLFDNAVRFREAGAELEVRVAFLPEAKTLCIELREPKQCAPASAAEMAAWGATPLHSTHRNAYGLGLFHARRVIEAHGGSFSAAYHAAPSPHRGKAAGRRQSAAAATSELSSPDAGAAPLRPGGVGHSLGEFVTTVHLPVIAAASAGERS